MVVVLGVVHRGSWVALVGAASAAVECVSVLGGFGCCDRVGSRGLICLIRCCPLVSIERCFSVGWCKRHSAAKADKKDHDKMIPKPGEHWVRKRDEDIGWHWSLFRDPTYKKGKK